MAVLAVVDEKTNRVVNHIVAELTDKPPEGYYFIDTEKKHVLRNAIWDKNNKKFTNPPNENEPVARDYSLTRSDVDSSTKK